MADLFCHRMRLRGARGQVLVPTAAPEQSSPVVVAIPRVWQTPRDERLRLPLLLVARVSSFEFAMVPRMRRIVAGADPFQQTRLVLGNVAELPQPATVPGLKLDVGQVPGAVAVGAM